MRFLGFCFHKWNIIERMNIVNKSGDIPDGYIYILQCEHCGEVKRRKIKDD